MFKNKFFNSIVFSLFIIGTLTSYSLVLADGETNLPDNVKITTNNNGSSTTVVIDSKPGYSTRVETSCVNGKCIHNAVSKKIDQKDIDEKIKKRQEYWNNFWKQQDEFFKAQEKMFKDLWSMSF